MMWCRMSNPRPESTGQRTLGVVLGTAVAGCSLAIKDGSAWKSILTATAPLIAFSVDAIGSRVVRQQERKDHARSQSDAITTAQDTMHRIELAYDLMIELDTKALEELVGSIDRSAQAGITVPPEKAQRRADLELRIGKHHDDKVAAVHSFVEAVRKATA